MNNYTTIITAALAILTAISFIASLRASNETRYSMKFCLQLCSSVFAIGTILCYLSPHVWFNHSKPLVNQAYADSLEKAQHIAFVKHIDSVQVEDFKRLRRTLGYQLSENIKANPKDWKLLSDTVTGEGWFLNRRLVLQNTKCNFKLAGRSYLMAGGCDWGLLVPEKKEFSEAECQHLLAAVTRYILQPLVKEEREKEIFKEQKLCQKLAECYNESLNKK